MLNNLNLVGRTTKDVDLRYLNNEKGTPVGRVTIAVEDRFKKKQDGKPVVYFIPVVIWGKQAEATAQYARKGSLIAVNGHLETRTYLDQRETKERFVMEVIADSVTFIQTKKGNNQNNGNQSNGQGQSTSSNNQMNPFEDTNNSEPFDIGDDELPF